MRAVPGSAPTLAASRSGVARSPAVSPMRSAIARPSRWPGVGSGAGGQSPSSGCGASGSASSSRLPSSTTARPSTMQWCALPTIVGGSSATHISHSGRSRASGVESTSSISASRSVWAACRWRAGSKSGIVDPDGVVDAQRHVGQLLAVAVGALHARRDVVDQLLGGRRVLGRLEARDPADVHRRELALDGQERRVERGQALRREARQADPPPLSVLAGPRHRAFRTARARSCRARTSTCRRPGRRPGRSGTSGGS